MAINNILSYYADINECFENDDHCANDGDCENTMGSFLCHCLYGWTGTHCETGKTFLHLSLYFASGHFLFSSYKLSLSEEANQFYVNINSNYVSKMS